MKMQAIALIGAIALGATAALAHEYKIGDLVIDHPMAFETATTAQTGGGFMTITNTGTAADTLIGVQADFPRVGLHTTEMDGDVARMLQVDGIAIPAGETVMLEPGGFHVMFMGLGGDPFEVGEEIPATLIFENAGTLEVVFNVEERKTGDHTMMDHSNH